MPYEGHQHDRPPAPADRTLPRAGRGPVAAAVAAVPLAGAAAAAWGAPAGGWPLAVSAALAAAAAAGWRALNTPAPHHPPAAWPSP
ncbi:hypothetical protein ACIRP0_14280 [Streptomyces sp. NPDC101733]|uniref:hypothetical protein n=1 Tax=unclassified Streptomyces TaxID=2593676 RepID=UPI003809EE6B